MVDMVFLTNCLLDMCELTSATCKSVLSSRME